MSRRGTYANTCSGAPTLRAYVKTLSCLTAGGDLHIGIAGTIGKKDLVRISPRQSSRIVSECAELIIPSRLVGLEAC
jgi:hypothetical protein